MKNIILNADSYKASHYLQYPEGVAGAYSYIESRGGLYDETLFFGLQGFMKEYLEGKVVTQNRITGRSSNELCACWGVDNPARCHSYDVSGLKRYNTVKRFEYVCDAGCVHSLSVRRHNSIVNDGKRYRCAKHAVPIKFTGVVAEIKRG